MTREQRYEAVLQHFRREQPLVSTELRHHTPFQLLVATVLSAQCTDSRINMVTPALFAHFPDARAMAGAEEAEVYELVKSVSYPNAKARHLVQLSRMLCDRFGGEVPASADDLVKLPGVGRKTANVVQAVAFGKAVMAVDTHVYRVSHRLGLVAPKDDTPLKVERRLMSHIPEQDVPNAHHWLLLHGRYVCTSRAPHCGKCPFDDFCPKLLENSKLD